MEVVGLAIGIAGLAGLFSSCLEAIELVQSYSESEADSTFLNNRLRAIKVRLERWGPSVGITEGSLASDHHSALDNKDVYNEVETLLSIIKTIGNATDTSTQPAPLAPNASSSLQRPHTLYTMPSQSKRQKLAWALWGKKGRTEQIERLETLVQDLHDLVPPDTGQSTETRTRRLERSTQLDDMRRVLEEIEREAKSVGSFTPGLDTFPQTTATMSQSATGWPEPVTFLLNRSCFLDWRSSVSPDTPKVLWINGPAAFGKTILCARIVQHLSSSIQTPVAHFFFSSDLESREDPFVAMRSWISQIVSQSEMAFELAYSKREADMNPAATRRKVVDLFSHLTRAVQGCTFIADGMDECTHLEGSGTSVATFINDVTEAITGTGTHVLFVSRSEPGIRHSLSRVSVALSEYEILLEDVRPDTAAVSQDIVDRQLPRKNDDIRSRVSEAMHQKCQGQFLWLKLHEQSLRKGMNEKQLHRAIQETPAGLDRIYNQNWERINALSEWEKDRAVALLRWVAVAVRALTVSELTEAVLIDGPEDLMVEELPDHIDEDYIDSEIVGLCGIFLNISSGKLNQSGRHRTVHLPHFTVRQYLLSRLPTPGWIRSSHLRSSQEQFHHTMLAKACLHYIGFSRVWEVHEDQSDNNSDNRSDQSSHNESDEEEILEPGSDQEVILKSHLDDEGTSESESEEEACESEPESGSQPRSSYLFEWRSTSESNPQYEAALGLSFRDYAAKEWHQHVNLGLCKDPETTKLATVFFESGMPVWHAWARLVDPRRPGGRKPDDDNNNDLPPPLLLAVWLHLTDLVMYLIDEKHCDVDEPDIYGASALDVACATDNTDIIGMLLDRGANIKSYHHRGGERLSVELYNNSEVFSYLLDEGRYTHIPTLTGFTPLHMASLFGAIEILQLLLERGFDVNMRDNKSQTPLHIALFSGYPRNEVIQLLLDNGADMTVSDIDGLNALHYCARLGKIEAAQLLLDSGADLDAQSTEGTTSLMLASGSGYDKIVELLLGRNADTKLTDRDGATALHHASSEGNTEIVKKLLDAGADVQHPAEPGSFSTPLILACIFNHAETTELLLAEGADVNEKDEKGFTSLCMAAVSGHLRIVKLLLKKGAKLSVGYKYTALQAAYDEGHTDIVELLLEESAKDPGSNADQVASGPSERRERRASV